MWKQAAFYGMLLAVGTLALQWLDYQRLARAHSGEIYAFLIAVFFLAIGIFIGVRVFTARKAESFGISERELTVLEELAEGRSNKEIAAKLNVSPNTIKAHVARLFEKLGAKRRADAINRARELAILP